VSGRRLPGAAGSAALALLLMGALGACGSSGPPEAAATVAGSKISSSRLERLTTTWVKSQTRTQLDEPNSPVEVSRKQSAKQVLTLLIRSTMLGRLASRHGIEDRPGPLDAAAPEEVPVAELAAAGWSRSDFAGALRNARLSKAIAERIFPDVAISDVEVRQYYDRHAQLYSEAWQAEVRVAYFDAAEPATALRERVARGESFEQAARELGSKESGSLGTVTPATPLPEAVLAAVEPLPRGGVSDPVPGGGGFLVLMVESRQDKASVTYEEARPDILALLVDQKRQRLFQRWFDKQLSQADIKVASHYGRWDPESLLVV
jgi:hypothetical protein